MMLYDSLQHGQSLNRFKHHCMAYRGPTVTLLRLGKEGLIIVAIDVEWRESTSSWGNSDCRVIQVRPKFQVLRAGPNLIFFNERARGLPSGIVLGQTSRPCVTLDTGLSSAKLHYQTDLTPQTISKIEVWGCGGQELKDKQQKQQQWERKQAEKLQKVKRPGRWDENPDKAILEMAGVTTNHSQR
ncbi:restriction of telomere capping protein 5-like [Orbicella faveolata]|uniref:restriction of telomere capping protein 5-like n=1 Tax=Orbicella faveolata TaxID=48498 RepID=UPI0009E4EC59|nr:restriction of telomere capping protein 5-like [Orbicella faveolata]